MDIYLERVVLKLTKLLSLKVFLELVVGGGGGGDRELPQFEYMSRGMQILLG